MENSTSGTCDWKRTPRLPHGSTARRVEGSGPEHGRNCGRETRDYGRNIAGLLTKSKARRWAARGQPAAYGGEDGTAVMRRTRTAAIGIGGGAGGRGARKQASGDRSRPRGVGQGRDRRKETEETELWGRPVDIEIGGGAGNPGAVEVPAAMEPRTRRPPGIRGHAMAADAAPCVRQRIIAAER